MLAYLCLGANLGEPEEQIQKAVTALAAHPRIVILQASSRVSTKPYGKLDQPDFWNQVLEIDTALSPAELLETILGIEADLGRIRDEKWGPRLIDIDILLYEDIVLNTSDLSLPHPDFHKRLFCLRLLSELVPDMIHPILNKDIATLTSELEQLEDTP